MSVSRSTPLTSRFQVIDGGAQPPSAWRDLPQTVAARSPFDRNKVCLFRLSRSSIAKMDVARRRQPILDAWTGVVGKVPPLNNSSILSKQPQADRLLSLTDAHACFRGVKRAVGDDKHGFDTVVYIVRQRWAVRYAPAMACPIEWFPIPDDAVLAIYVRLDQPEQGRYGMPDTSGAPVRGVVSHWHYVEVDPDGSYLPVGHSARYRRRLW